MVAAEVVRRQKVRAALRLILSFAASAVGGLAAVVVFVVGMGDELGYDLIRGLWLVSLAVGFNVGPAWMLVVAPLALGLSPDSPLLRRGWAALFGASCGVVLVCIALRFVWDVPRDASDAPAVLAACACGAVTCELYGFLLRRESGDAPPAGPSDSTS